MMALRGHTRHTLESRIMTREGEEKWVWDNGVGVYDAPALGDVQALHAADYSSIGQLIPAEMPPSTRMT